MSEQLSFDAHQALQYAQQAYHVGDRRLARRWAERAAALAPNREEPWMWLASLSSPQASVFYLQRALTINPHSEPARKAMRWAIQRLRSEQATQPVKVGRTQAGAAYAGQTVPGATAVSRQVAWPPLRRRIVATAIPPKNMVARRSLVSLPNLVGALALAFIGIVVCLGLAAAPFVQAAFAEDGPISIAQVILDKPTRTPTITPTFTPSPTFTSTPIPTDTPTPLPTETPIPTDTPPPPPPEPENPGFPGLPEGVGESDPWIDVNLSQQSAYAYRGGELVNTFIVSTGTWEHPTVTGTYQIYVKYRYADMAGPGYYLPNVPYVMYFYEGYGLHGTYWHNNFGTPMSHGCINFSIDDAGWVFDFTDVGTVVNIHY